MNRRNFLKQATKTATILGSVGAFPALLGSCAGTKPKNLQITGSSDAGILCIQTAFTKSFLMKCIGGYLLIDTSYPNEYLNFTEALEAIGVGVEQIKYVLLTHHHDDHAGFMNQLAQDTDARMIVHENALPHLRIGKNDTSSKPLNLCVRMLLGAYSVVHDFQYPPVRLRDKDIVLKDDDTRFLKEIGINGSILYTPGHSNDSISVILDDGSCFAGDAAMDLLAICLCNHRPIFVQDEKQVFVSWEKMKDHGAKIIYPAHGDPIDMDALVHS